MNAWTVGKPVNGRLRIHMPYRNDTRRKFLALGIRPVWDAKHKQWRVSRERMQEVLHLLFTLYGPGLVIVRGHAQEQCDTRCQRAKGLDCVCSCAGAHHRAMNEDAWTQVGATVLVRADVTESRFIYNEN